VFNNPFDECYQMNPPIPLEAKFYKEGWRFFIRFDKSVDQSLVGTNGNKLLKFSSQLGQYYVVKWTMNYTIMEISLGNDATMPAGTEIDLNPDFLRGTGTYSWTGDYVDILLLETVPDMPIPEVIIKAPKLHSINFDLIVDASPTRYGMFQNMTYTWTFESNAPSSSTSSLLDFLEPVS
jgi:hypothetical protein